jgi:hypothetical protein
MLKNLSRRALIGALRLARRRLRNPLLDGPANLAFHNRTAWLLMANHAAFTANPADFAVLNRRSRRAACDAQPAMMS